MIDFCSCSERKLNCGGRLIRGWKFNKIQENNPQRSDEKQQLLLIFEDEEYFEDFRFG